jgi:hypothetical protein
MTRRVDALAQGRADQREGSLHDFGAATISFATGTEWPVRIGAHIFVICPSHGRLSRTLPSSNPELQANSCNRRGEQQQPYQPSAGTKLIDK